MTAEHDCAFLNCVGVYSIVNGDIFSFINNISIEHDLPQISKFSVFSLSLLLLLLQLSFAVLRRLLGSMQCRAKLLYLLLKRRFLFCPILRCCLRNGFLV